MSALVLTGAKKGGAAKRIAHSHSTNNMKINSKPMQVVSGVLRRKLNRVATDRVACGEDAGKFLFGAKQRFIVVHNGIDLERFRFNANTRHKMREQCGFNEDDMILLNVGRYEKVKNHEKLIDIFGDYSRKHKNAHLLIIGDGSLKEALEEKIASERLEKSVTLLPSQDKVERYFMMADVFVMPSLFEGIPNVGVEAQACGMKPTAYLRNIAINGAVNVYDAAEFSWIRQHISCLVSNINQIAKVANSTGSVYANDISIMQET
jgi:glycosyltransferase involved in cell wall biosynthesis